MPRGVEVAGGERKHRIQPLSPCLLRWRGQQTKAERAIECPNANLRPLRVPQGYFLRVKFVLPLLTDVDFSLAFLVSVLVSVGNQKRPIWAITNNSAVLANRAGNIDNHNQSKWIQTFLRGLRIRRSEVRILLGVPRESRGCGGLRSPFLVSVLGIASGLVPVRAPFCSER